MAVKPRPPAVFTDMVWLEPLTRRNPVKPQRAPERAMVLSITFFTLIPAYLAVFSLSPTNNYNIYTVIEVSEYAAQK